MIRVLIVTGLLFLLAPAHAGTRVALEPNFSSAPTDLNLDWCAAAAAYSREHGGDEIRVEQGGQLVYENYAPGYDAGTVQKIYSGTKSYFSVTAMLLVQRGELRLDEKASDTLTEWKNDARKNITIDELLSQTSGLNPNGASIYASRDQLSAAVRMRLVDPPGTRFHYGAAGYQAFGEILRRKFGTSRRTVEDIVAENLLDPYGLKVESWKRDDAGNVLVHAGMLMTAEEWAKFGGLLLQPAPSADGQGRGLGFPELFKGHGANPAYGLGFWLNAPQNPHTHQRIRDLLPAMDGEQLYPGGPRDLFACIGTGKVRLYMLPSRHLVIVRFAHEAHYSDGDFLSRLLTGKPHPDAHSH